MIYFDHHAATPVGREVQDRMREAAVDGWANPSSVHAAGRAARRWIERAREEIAASIGAAPVDLVLTAGGTEACNLGVLGLVERPRRIVTTAIEHPAVAAAIAAHGAEVVRLAVPRGRPPSLEALSEALDGAELAAFTWVNHETGTELPVATYAAACAERKIPCFIDATQALGKIPVDVGALGASAVAFASSKLGGPHGAGALFVARGSSVIPRALGGGQERGRRAGTLDPVALAGFGAAAAQAEARLAAMPEVAARRDRLEAALVALGCAVNAPDGPRVATVTAVSAPGWRGRALVAALDLEDLAASSGPACSSGVDAPSEVVLHMHADEPWRAAAALRLSLGPAWAGEAEGDVAEALRILARVLPRRGGKVP